MRDLEVSGIAHKTRISWAAAVEHDATERWTPAAELFGQAGLPTSTQVGLRWWVVPGRVQLTSSLGTQNRNGHDGQWISLGIRFETGTLLSR